jgi:hypothetical protein
MRRNIRRKPVIRLGACRGQAGWIVLLAAAAGSTAEGQGAPEASEQVVGSEWMPIPAFVVPKIALTKGSWKRIAGWAPHTLAVERRVEGAVLEVTLLDGDGYSGAPLSLRFERLADGRVSVTATGRAYSCVTHETFVDLHGEVRMQRRTASGVAPLRFSFRLDGITDFLLNPLRNEGEVEVVLAPGEWDVACEAPVWVEPEASTAGAHEVWWRWPDGKARAHGRVDAFGRREGAWETWYADGAFQSATEFLAGERHGACRVADAKGSCVRDGRLEHGVEQGEWIETYQDESISESFRVPYRNGVRGKEQSQGKRPRVAPPDR